MGHHRGADDPHRDVERFTVKPEHRDAAARDAREQARRAVRAARHEAGENRHDVRAGERHLGREAQADGGDQHDDQRLEPAHAEPREREQQQHVERRDHHAEEERDVEQELEPDRRPQHLGEVARDDRDLAQQPQWDHE